MKRIIQTLVFTAAIAVTQSAWSATRNSGDWQPSLDVSSAYPIDAETSFIREPLETHAGRYAAREQARDGWSMAAVTAFPIDAESSFLREAVATYADRVSPDELARTGYSVAALPYPLDAETSFFHELPATYAGSYGVDQQLTGEPFTANLAAHER